jgi:hypothetical protein
MTARAWFLGKAIRLVVTAMISTRALPRQSHLLIAGVSPSLKSPKDFAEP